MMRRCILVIMSILPLLLMAQRKVTPVETDDNKVEKPRQQ